MIRAAYKAAPSADHQVQWTLKKASGRDGGIVGFTELTAMIEAAIMEGDRGIVPVRGTAAKLRRLISFSR